MLVKETYNNVICQWNVIGTYLIDRVLEFRKQKIVSTLIDCLSSGI